MREPANLERQLSHLTDRLAADFAGRYSPEVVGRLVREAASGLGSARVTQFIPVLVEREVRHRLLDRRRAVAGR